MFKIVMENIIKYSSRIETTIVDLKNELNTLRQVYNNNRIIKLNEENLLLSKRVEEAKALLIKLETVRGIKQINILKPYDPDVMEKIDVLEGKTDLAVVEDGNKELAPVEKNNSTKKEKKKKTEPVSRTKSDAADVFPVDVGRLDMRVGKILKVEKHPDADSLYVSQVECGDPTPRTVVSGLVKFITTDELQGRKVVVLCNLKPVKMRGVMSEAMVMCASTPEIVEVLCPPDVSQPGDVVECEGYVRHPDTQLNPKKKIFETVAPDLRTNDELCACYMGKPLVVSGQTVTTKSLRNVQIK